MFLSDLNLGEMLMSVVDIIMQVMMFMEFTKWMPIT